jgi:hypothetical protein
LVNVVPDPPRAEARGEAMTEDLGEETISDAAIACLHHAVDHAARWPATNSLGRREGLPAAMALLMHEAELGWATPSDAKPGQTIVPRYYARARSLSTKGGASLRAESTTIRRDVRALRHRD